MLKNVIKALCRASTRLFAVAVFGAGVPLLAVAQAPYPNRPIRIVVPYSPGTAVDTLVRVISADLGKELGQSVVVENRVGAASAIGTAYAAKAAPDGYTLLMAQNTHVITAASRKTPYHPIDDFAPIGGMATGPMVVLVNSTVPASTFPQLVEYLRKSRDEATYSSPGVGSTGHLFSLVLQEAIGSTMRHVPANGMTVAVMDVMQNNTTLVLSGVESTLPGTASGRLKAIALTGKSPSRLLPNVPSVAQSGYPDVDLSLWIGMYAPAGTPRPIIDRVNAAMRSVVNMPTIRQSIADKGYDVALSSPEEFATLTRREFVQWTKVVEKYGLRTNE